MEKESKESLVSLNFKTSHSRELNDNRKKRRMIEISIPIEPLIDIIIQLNKIALVPVAFQQKLFTMLNHPFPLFLLPESNDKK